MFYIHPLEQPLLDAAIRLGNWFIANADLSAAQSESVIRVVEAIRRLPAVSEDVSGSFGFQFTDNSIEDWDGTSDVPIGEHGCWDVSYYPTADTPDNLARGQIWLEIFNNRTTLPQSHHDDLYDIRHELDFNRTSVDTTEKDYSCYVPSAFFLARMYDWINCVDRIGRFRDNQDHFEIDVT